MKKIAVFFKTPGAMGSPFSKPEYWTGYSELSQVIAKHGGQLYITREQHTYQGNGSFSQSWIIENNVLKETGAVTVDVIYDKGRFVHDNTIPILNCEKVKNVCNNKWLMYQTYSSFCPQTFFTEHEHELLSLLPRISTKKIVYKPFTGAEGVGVKIEEKEYFTRQAHTLQFPGVVSEFLDTSGGIPGIVDGTHDLRVTLLNGKILHSFVRTPPNGSLLANVSQGGRLEVVDPKKLPPDIITIAQTIDSDLSECGHRLYCIDFGYTDQGPKIIEMNSELGLLANSVHPIYITLKEKLAEIFMEM